VLTSRQTRLLGQQGRYPKFTIYVQELSDVDLRRLATRFFNTPPQVGDFQVSVDGLVSGDDEFEMVRSEAWSIVLDEVKHRKHEGVAMFKNINKILWAGRLDRYTTEKA